MALRNYLYSKHKQDDDISNMIYHRNGETEKDSEPKDAEQETKAEKESCDEPRSDTLVHDEHELNMTNMVKMVSINPNASESSKISAEFVNQKVSSEDLHYKSFVGNERSDSVDTVRSVENTEQAGLQSK